MTKWPKTPLASVIQHRKEFIQIDDLVNYKRCRVQLHAQGIAPRDTILGAEIKTKKQQVCQTGDLLIAEIDAKVGGFGIVPKELNRAIVSSHYFLFDINEYLLDRRFLDFFIRTPAFREQVTAQGSTNYAAIRPDHVLGYTIPLPPLPEQQRIVARIEALAAKINEIKKIREYSDLEASILYKSALATQLNSKDGHWIKETVNDVITKIDAGWSPQCEDRPANDGEWGVLKTTSVQWCEFRQHENKALPLALTPRPELCVQKDDVLVTRAGPRKRVGVVAAVRKSSPQLMISDKLIRLRPNKSKIEPRFLELSLASPYSQKHLVKRKTGLADAQVNISQEILRTTPITYPDLPQQRHIVECIDDVQAKAYTLKKLQAEAAAELNALLPSILDKAFKGEL